MLFFLSISPDLNQSRIRPMIYFGATCRRKSPRREIKQNQSQPTSGLLINSRLSYGLPVRSKLAYRFRRQQTGSSTFKAGMRPRQQLIHSHPCGSRSFSKSYSHASFVLKVWWELKRSVGIWDISTVMTSPETQVQKPWKKKTTGASHPTCGTTCPKHRESIILRQGGAHTNVFLSFLL